MLRAAARESFKLSTSASFVRVRAWRCSAPALTRYSVGPISEEQALSIGMFRYQPHLQLGLYADPTALPGAVPRPDVPAEEMRALRDARPAPTPC